MTMHVPASPCNTKRGIRRIMIGPTRESTLHGQFLKYHSLTDRLIS